VSQHLQDVTLHQDELWSVGAQVTGPLFQAGALKGEYDAAKAIAQTAKLQYEQTALAAFADVANALVTRQKLGEVRGLQEHEVAAYQDAVRYAEDRYKSGLIGYFELLQTQQLLYPAESALAQTRRDELISIVQLYKALGGGWSLRDPAAWQDAAAAR